jgi:hypothetical protein
MPLDVNKIAHIRSVWQRRMQGRMQTVVFVRLASGGGSTIFTTVQVILRSQAVIDPEVPDASRWSLGKPADTLLVAPITTDFTGVVMVADTAVATVAGVAAARKYEVIEVRPAGIVPGGTHYVARLRRFR